ncbi:30S ribosomal protein S8 [bacterium]|nr:30S ribosomal protein S8 [bacterium]
MGDMIADLFTRIRNGGAVKHSDVEVPFSKMKLSVVKILKDEGFIKFFDVVNEDKNKKAIKIGLKYGPDGRHVVSEIRKISRSGKRIYVKKANVPKVRNGFGVSILSTSQGVMTGRSARLSNVGGELIGIIY